MPRSKRDVSHTARTFSASRSSRDFHLFYRPCSIHRHALPTQPSFDPLPIELPPRGTPAKPPAPK
jgi:hypothetical protein